MKKTLQGMFLIITTLFFTTGCFLFKPTPKTPAPEKVAINFDYAPPSTGTTKSNAIKFALVRPRFVPTFKAPNSEPFATFVKNMSTDFVEMLTARGYSYIGPLSTYDEMVYSDKKSTDLVLEAEVDLQFTGNDLKTSTYVNPNTKQTTRYYWYDGNTTITGKVNLIFSEPFTKTKIWVKSVPIEPNTIYMKSMSKYYNEASALNDPLAWNTLVAGLEKSYQQVLTTAWNHLEPEELLVKKGEAQEIKKNSGFIKN